MSLISLLLHQSINFSTVGLVVVYLLKLLTAEVSAVHTGLSAHWQNQL